MTTPRGSIGSTSPRTLGLPSCLLLVVLLSAGVVFSTRAHAGQKTPEKPYALIYGTIYGPDDHSVYGVKVKIRRAEEKNARWELYSDHSGEFAQRVPPGRADYVVWADLKGYKSLNGKKLEGGQEVTVHIENEERQDISLHLK